MDRQATRQVQDLLSPEERDRFDRALIGVMGIDLGIDLGIGDGHWHRMVQPDGSVVFPDPED